MQLSERSFTVAPLEDNRWGVSSEGSGSVALFVSRRDAIQYAHARAQAFRPSVLRVLSPCGALEDMWRYGSFKGIRRAGSDAAQTSSQDADPPQSGERPSL
jgi:hypothetical protein